MLRLRAAYRVLPKHVFSCQRLISEGIKPSRPPSKYKTAVKSLITTFKKELGAVQAIEEKEALKRKMEEQNEIKRMLELNELENKKITVQRYLIQSLAQGVIDKRPRKWALIISNR